MNQVVDVKNLSFRYKTADTFCLRDIEFSLGQGECAVLMGASASGKTTLCHCLNGLIPQVVEGDLQGQVKTAGKDPSLFRVQTMARKVGLVMQDPEVQIIGRTVYEDVAFGPRNFLVPPDEIERRVGYVLHQVGLSGYENRDTDALSGGEKQRLTIAGVLAMNPEILILDEPASELDPRGRAELYGLLEKMQRDSGLSLILVEQRIDDILQMIDRIILMDEGRIKWTGNPLKMHPECSVSRRVNPDSEKRLKKADTTHRVALEINHLNFSYTPHVPVLKEINLSIRQNDFIALTGHNGAGKTSLAKHLNGLIPCQAGSICYYGKNIKTMTRRELSESIGFVFQNPDHQIFESTVEKEISFGLSNRGLTKDQIKHRVDRTIDYIGLNTCRNHHPFTLGKGIRQMIAVASIVALKPGILVVDEPTTGLDAHGTMKIMAVIEKLHKDGTAIILISHDMAIVERYANRMIVLHQGKIICDDTPKLVLQQKEIRGTSRLIQVNSKGSDTK